MTPFSVPDLGYQDKRLLVDGGCAPLSCAPWMTVKLPDEEGSCLKGTLGAELPALADRPRFSTSSLHTYDNNPSFTMGPTLPLGCRLIFPSSPEPQLDSNLLC